MDDATVRRLAALNEAFYSRFAAPFAASRAGPQPGYERLLAYVPAGRPRVLDAGCGDGRFGRFLRASGREVDYVGVDFSAALLAARDVDGDVDGDVAGDVAGRFEQRDLSQPGSLDGLGRFDLIVCLSTLQHIPGRRNRARLLAEMAACLTAGGHIALANWQFLGSARQRRKIRSWAEVGLDEGAVEPGDYLLSWQRGGEGRRYVALVDDEETRRLAEGAGLRIAELFRSDGREGDLNLYALLAG